jgi:biopolymer transport protein ExbD
MPYNPRLARQARQARGGQDVKLNITSMMDMFTIILVFLLKSFSTQGQLITPATGLLLPTSTVERTTRSSLDVQITKSNILVQDKIVIDEKGYAAILGQKDFMIQKLYDVLETYAEAGRKMTEISGSDVSGEITIQGDVNIPYKLLTRVMYTCGQAGYPAMNLVVYRKE